jgi:putative peptide zinc metalloprotease protein
VVELERPPGLPADFPGQRVEVRFDHGSEPLAVQWYRSLRQLFLARFGV